MNYFTKCSIINTSTYIWLHEDENIKLDTLAKRANLSSSHFRRLFHQYSGESLHTHLSRIRLEHAAVWLKYTSLPIIDIATIIGFSSREGFSRAFKAHFHYSPKFYRARVKEKTEIPMPTDRYGTLVPSIKIIKTSSVKVAFLRQFGDYFKVPFTWKRLGELAEKKSFLHSADCCIGVNYDDPEITKSKYLRYDACIPIPEEIDFSLDDNGLCIQTLPGGWFAEVSFEGTAFEEEALWNYLTLLWLPKSGYSLSDFRCLSIYPIKLIPSSWLDASKLLTKRYKATLRIPIQK
ncbi:MAG: hypothetical protein DRG24_04130 [Epsilonproteobacteria bacterium]|nr:MAG: hypothetical protein DRG24_04130 [Campylobacterota bacterium]